MPNLNQLLENEMHLAWEDGCLACVGPSAWPPFFNVTFQTLFAFG